MTASLKRAPTTPSGVDAIPSRLSSACSLTFLILEFQSIGRNLHREGNARHGWGEVEVRKLHRRSDRARLCVCRPALQILPGSRAGEHVLRFGFAVVGTGADGGSAAIHFDAQGVATAFFRDFSGLGRSVAEDVGLALLLAYPLQSRRQLAGIGNREPSGSTSKPEEELGIVAFRATLREYRGRDGIVGLNVLLSLHVSPYRHHIGFDGAMRSCAHVRSTQMYVKRINRDVGFVTSVDGGGQLRFLGVRLWNPSSQDDCLAAWKDGQTSGQAAHGANGVQRRGIGGNSGGYRPIHTLLEAAGVVGEVLLDARPPA